MKKHSFVAQLLLAGTAVIAPTMALAQGQSQSGTGQADTSAAPSEAVADIIVVATKRSENVQKIPISVSVVSQEQLQARNLTDSTQLARIAPSVTFVAGATTNTSIFSIRGIGTIANSVGLEPSVGVTKDGVPVARSLGSIADLIDLDHVEILNGPQGTVFGKNASAGVIALITQKPKLNTFELNARESYATYNYNQFSSTVNVPLGDNVAVRGSIWHNQHDGLVDAFKLGKKFGDLDSSGARMRLRWQPTPDLDVVLSGEWTEHNENGQATTLREFNTTSPIFVAQGGGRVQAYELSQDVVAGPDNLRTSTTRPELHTIGHTNAYTAEVNYSLGDYTVTAVAAYRKIVEDDRFEATGTGNPFFIGDNSVGDRDIYSQITGELRVASPSTNRLRFVLGGFFYKLKLNDAFSIDTNVAPTPVTYISVLSRTHIDTTNYAAFGEGTFDITDRFRLTAGARVSHDANSGTLTRDYLRAPASGLPPTVNGPGTGFGPAFLSVDGVDYTNLSGRVSLQYDVAHGSMLYATVSRGYKGPGINFAFNTTPATLGTGAVQPELSTMYEVGLKSLLFDRRLRLNIAVYDETIDNFQATVRLPGFPAFIVQNAKQLKSDGVTAEFDAKLTADFTVSGSAAYQNARYTSFTNASCYGGQTASQGCTGGVQSLNGYPLASAPKWSFNLTGRYEHDLTSNWRGFLQVNDSFRTSIVFNADRDPHEVQPSLNLVNFLIGARMMNNRLGLSVFVNNAFDNHFVTRIGATASNAWFLQNPTTDAYRSIGFALDFHY